MLRVGVFLSVEKLGLFADVVLRLRCADRRYQAKVKAIDSLPSTPEELKRAARERALTKIGETLERYVDTT